MFQYFSARLKRKIRASLSRAYYEGRFKFDLDRLARGLAAVFIISVSLTAVPREAVDASRFAEEGKTAEQKSGKVSGVDEVESTGSTQPEWPKKREGAPNLGELTAEAVLVVDGETGKVLYEKNKNLQLSPASLTKIMTALVALERYELGQEFVVSEACLLGLEGKAHMNLQAGERLITKDLLYGLLLHSAADAACVLTRDHETVYDDSRAGEADFIVRMNQKARDLGMTDTQFENTVGLDSEGHYTTAEDLMKLIRAAMENRVFQIIVATREINVHDAGEPPTRWHGLENTNDLLFELPEVTGIKTGTTGEAGECFATSWVWPTARGPGEVRESHDVYAVLLGAGEDKRFEEMKKVIKWVSDAYYFYD